MRVMQVPWKEVPVEMRYLVAKQFVIELVRPEAALDGQGQEAHFLEITPAFRLAKLTQLRRVTPGDKHTIAEIGLPRSQESYGVRELPHDFVGRQMFQCGQLEAEGTVRLRHARIP